MTRPVRGWMFWRKAFWTRPAFFVVMAIGAVVAIPFLVRDGYQDVRNARVVEQRRFCEESRPPCLTRHYGRLDEENRRRDIGEEWSFWIGQEEFDSFHVRFKHDDDVRAVKDEATVETIGGDVVAVETSSGYVPVWALGWRGAARAAILVVCCIGGVLGAVSYARRKAMAYRSWWAVDGPPVDPASGWAAAFLVPGAISFLVMAVGVPWWPVWLAALILPMAYAGYALAPWKAQPSQGRHRSTYADETGT